VLPSQILPSLACIYSNVNLEKKEKEVESKPKKQWEGKDPRWNGLVKIDVA
jgi:hypothetical protein